MYLEENIKQTYCICFDCNRTNFESFIKSYLEFFKENKIIIIYNEDKYHGDIIIFKKEILHFFLQKKSIKYITILFTNSIIENLKTEYHNTDYVLNNSTFFKLLIRQFGKYKLLTFNDFCKYNIYNNNNNNNNIDLNIYFQCKHFEVLEYINSFNINKSIFLNETHELDEVKLDEVKHDEVKLDQVMQFKNFKDLFKIIKKYITNNCYFIELFVNPTDLYTILNFLKSINKDQLIQDIYVDLTKNNMFFKRDELLLDDIKKKLFIKLLKKI